MSKRDDVIKDAGLLLHLHRTDLGTESVMIALHLLRNLYSIASEHEDARQSASAVRKAVLEEAIEDIKELAADTEQLKLHMGELSAQEVRTLKSALNNLVPYKLKNLMCHERSAQVDQSVSAQAPLQSDNHREAE